MPPPLRPKPKFDDQNDYEDPVDRYLRREPGAKAVKPVSGLAHSARAMGIVALIPCLGLVFAPITLLLAFQARGERRRNPKLGGKLVVGTAFWFAGVGLFINYGVPAIFYLFMYLGFNRRW